MGTKARVVKVAHNQHIAYITRVAKNVAWIRHCKVDVPRDMFDEEHQGFPDGFVELVATWHSAGSPGISPILGVACQFVDVPGTEDVTGDLYYYAVLEVGGALISKDLAPPELFDSESIITPPAWLALPAPDTVLTSDLESHPEDGEKEKEDDV